MSKVKIFGLIGEFLHKTNGIPFSAELSMILEQLLKDNAEMIESMKRVESIVQGQVLGLAESGKIALANATSEYLSVDEKFAEIRLAKEKFQDCYGALFKIPELNVYRGEVAFQIAFCNAMLGINDRRDEWLKVSLRDFLEFGNATLEEASWATKTALKAASFSKYVSYGMIYVGAGAGPVGVVLGLAAAGTMHEVSKNTSAKLEAIETKEAQFRVDQAYALDALGEVKEIIALVQPADKSSDTSTAD